jgi:hypothetical protein
MEYSDELKLAIVRDYESGTDGQKVVAKRHGVEATSLRSDQGAFLAGAEVRDTCSRVLFHFLSAPPLVPCQCIRRRTYPRSTAKFR